MRALDPRLLRRTRAARVALGADVVLGLAATACVLGQAVVVAALVAGAFDGRPVAEQGRLLVALVGLVVARAVLAGSVESVGRWAAGRVMSELRRALVRHRLRGGHSGDAPGDPVESGEVATAAVAGVDALEVYLARYLPQVVLAVAVPIAVLVVTLAIDPTSAAVMLVTLPAIPVFMALVGRLSADRARARWQALSRLSNHVLDVVRGLPTLRAYNRAEAQADLVGASAERYRLTTMQVLRVSFLSGAVLDLAATIGTALVAVTLGVRVIDGDLGLQAALTVLLLTPELYAPIRSLGAQYHASVDGLAAAERILDLLGPDAPDVGAAGQVPDWREVRLTGVTVERPGRAGPVLCGLDLRLRRGEVVALVGPSGAGKTTAAAVLLGLCRPDRGRVTVDGHDLGTLDQDWWHRQAGWLPQRPTMFRGTIRDNIALGDPHASAERVAEAARLAGVAEFVAELRLGYDTRIGAGGRGLSAGEQRRVALARALLRDAPLLVLDEPTANLDPETAAVVAAAIARVAAGRAVLVIEHRRSRAGRRPHGRAQPRRGSPAAGSGTGTRPRCTCGAPMRTLVRLVRLARPPIGRLLLSVLLGAAAVLAGVGLMALAGYLISRCAEHPPVLSLTVVIVAVRAFGIARPVARYAERLVSHDLAFRVLARTRIAAVRQLAARLPDRAGRDRDGDLLARLVGDIDATQNLFLRGLSPPLAALLSGAVSVAATAVLLPPAAVVVAAGMVAGGVLVPALAAAAGRSGQRRARVRAARTRAMRT